MITNIYWLVIGLALRGAVLAPCRIRRHPMPWMGTAPAQVPGVEERLLLHQRCDIADASMPQGQEDLCR